MARATTKSPRSGAKRLAKRPRAHARHAAHTDDPPFSVVGIGASAGGLEAFTAFFDAMASDSGMAFVLIQHLDPTHQSMMVDLLASHTKMRVMLARDHMAVESNHVYVIPPGAYLTIRKSELRLSPAKRKEGPSIRMPLDVFLRSLAADKGDQAISIILSGTGTDGSLGLKAVKENGGLVIAQNPAESSYDGMPRSAIATGAVDLVLPIKKIPRMLLSYGKQKRAAKPSGVRPLGARSSNLLDRIVDVLKAQTGRDIAPYKPNTLLRRVERRMALNHVKDPDKYVKILESNSDETTRLVNDLFINVTAFFRDADVFKFLETQTIPGLIANHDGGLPLRAWVAGCSTGQEAYSIAMLLIEQIAAAKKWIKPQVFATDIDAEALEIARAGVYPDSIAGDMSPARLGRFLVHEEHGYRVREELRQCVIFTAHDLLVDPPFSRIDLISCRNLLIYLRPEVQEKVFSLFRFALNDGGVLVLGSSETVGSATGWFEPIAKGFQIYRVVGRSPRLPTTLQSPARKTVLTLEPTSQPVTDRKRPDTADVAYRAMLEAYAPASALINRHYQALFFYGPIDRYLKLTGGEASLNVIAIAREGIRPKLRVAVQTAAKRDKEVVLRGIPMRRRRRAVDVTLEVRPVRNGGEKLFLVSFVDEPSTSIPRLKPVRPTKAEAPMVEQLEYELEATRQELQDTTKDLEGRNEELRAVNEEAMSATEEFHATNEELEASKEELQSLNEELTTLNNQLQESFDRERSISGDLKNVLSSSDVATLCLDTGLNIRFLTPAVRRLFNILPSDIGRSIKDFTTRFSDPELIQDAKQVLTDLTPQKREVMTVAGIWYNRRILVYRTIDGKIDGVVITFSEVTDLKHTEQSAIIAQAYAEGIVNTVREPLIILDDRLRVVSSNRAFYEFFGTTPGETVGKLLGEVCGRALDQPDLERLLKRLMAGVKALEDFEVKLASAAGDERVIVINAREIWDGGAALGKILVAMEDVTANQRAGEALRAAKQLAENASDAKSRFLLAASHDLRQPLQTMSLLHGLLSRKVQDSALAEVVADLGAALAGMGDTLNSLLDINQLESGTLVPSITAFPVRSLLYRLRHEFREPARVKGLELRVVESSLVVRTDQRLLERIIENLMSNAFKYTDVGKVVLGCRRHGNKVRVEVWDSGIGIPAGQLELIFQEYYRMDVPMARRSGLGLGLSIVRRLTQLLGLDLKVRSTPGRGSVFSIDVPMGIPDGARVEAGRTGVVSADGNSRPTILLVEDNQTVRDSLKKLLEFEGFRVSAKSSGARALGAIRSSMTAPDLIIADFGLPGEPNGTELVEGLRKKARRDIPALILTGDTSKQKEIVGKGFRCMVKPVDAGKLIATIGQLTAPPVVVPTRLYSLSTARSTASQPTPLSPQVFVVDDEEAVRNAMRLFLQSSGFSVESYPSAEAFLAERRGKESGCLVVDISMPGMSGIELQKTLKARGDTLPVIVMTAAHGETRLAVLAMRAGAVDFIEKPVTGEALLESVRRAMELKGRTTDAEREKTDITGRFNQLARRERQVMTLIADGNANKEIATHLRLSPRTVEHHRARIMKKMMARSFAELVRMSVIAGLKTGQA